MRIFFIRHGETEHNVAGLLAGVSDSRLTNHGVLQTQRLGTSLIKDRGLHFSNVYASDLQRAFMTANEICKAHNSSNEDAAKLEVVKLEILREQDFGSLELVPWSSKRADQTLPRTDDPAFKPKETSDAMKQRASTFLDDYVVPLIALDDAETATIAVVSHGLFLAQLWKVLLSRFTPRSIIIDPDFDLSLSRQSLESMAWSNTGYLEVDIQIKTSSGVTLPSSEISKDPLATTPFSNARMTIKAVNDKRHLLNLKRARGGLGSAAHDQRQQDLKDFFNPASTKRTKTETKNSS